MLLLIVLFFFLCSFLFFTHRRLLQYLQFFQQEEYNAKRFLAWLWGKKAFDTRGSIACAFGLIASLLLKTPELLAPFFIAAIYLAIVAALEKDPRRSGKLVLNMTDRARRIYRVAFIILTVSLLAILCLDHCFAPGTRPWCVWVSLAVLIQAIPISLMLSNFCLLPAEKKRQAAFVADAKRILSNTHPTVIGITGSYGKTSTKMVLNEMLAVVEPTFTLSRSINTVMGITREIRSRMKPGHRYAVIEMGAYQRGSIKKLCALTPPNAAIVTAVGAMHLERFGSIDNVLLAKSELAQGLPQNGILVCNGDDERTRKIAAQNPKDCTLLYGFDLDRPLDCWMTDVTPTDNGTTFTVHWNGREYSGTTPLCGRPMLSNILAAFTMACALGHDPKVMLAVVASMEPVENRLQLKKSTVYRTMRPGEEGVPAKVRIVELRDAYNSNPIGFAAALDELGRRNGKRKILITPGMIELGDRQEVENEKIAAHAASVCQLVIIVGPTNEPALRAGLKKGGLPESNVHSFPTRDKAFEFLRSSHEDEDVVLIENDLPDLYEVTASF